MKYKVVFAFWLIAHMGAAQLLVKPLGDNQLSRAKVAKQHATTIELPFWDDFSTSTGLVDTAWWLPESQVQVIAMPGIGIDPPTLNVVTFDGVDALGNPYQSAPTDGVVDSLVSLPIDMTKVPVSLRNTVYLSFFYQTQGLGEAPEEQDSLILYMKDIDGSWNKVWPTSPSDNYNTDPLVFTERFIQVNDPTYFHTEFQFMFKAIGRQNGWFDNWLLDYVYMDKRRSASDNSYLDRAFTAPPSSIFDLYTAIPFDDFVATVDKNMLFTTTSTKLRNLENDIQPVEYSIILYDTLNKTLIESLTVDQELVLQSNTLQTIDGSALNPSLLDTNADSLYLMLEYLVSSGDKLLVDSIYNNDIDTAFYSHINLRQNDTTRRYFNLNDYYAYDDGTAEFGAGINQPQGKIAYLYEVVVGKYLDRIDIYFPNIDGNQSGTPLELFVLNDFEGNENSLLLNSNISISHTGINQFIEYNLPSPIFVTDTVFIGFTNLSSTNEWLGVGLDKNTDSFDRIYVNVDGNWVQNEDVHGSLMMRPHFTDEPPITGIENELNDNFNVYPNPSGGKLHVEGTYTRIELYDLFGRKIPFEINRFGELNYHVNSSQLLILQMHTKQGIFSQRIMANPSNQ